MRRFGHENPAAPVAARLKSGTDRHHAAELAMRACTRAQRDGGHPGQGFQPIRQGVDQRQCPGHRRHRLERVDIGKSGEPRQLLVEPRIVLHRARAKLIEPAVDGVVLLRQPGEVADNLRLAETGQADLCLPL